MPSLPTLLRSSSLRAASLTDSTALPAGQSPPHSQPAKPHHQGSALPQQQLQAQPQHSLDAGGTGSGSPDPPSLTDPVLAQPWTELLAGLKGSLTGLVQLVWLLGRLGVPTACVVLAASQADVLHGVYLVIMLAYLLVSCTGLQPRAKPVPLWWAQHVASSTSPSSTAAASSLSGSGAAAGNAAGPTQFSQEQPHALPAASLPQHRLLRLYGSCHLLVVYLALVLQLPGLDSALNEYILRLVGLWDPKILSDLVPVLLLLVAATTHVILGKWLLTRPPAGTGWPAAGAALVAAAPAQSAGAAGSAGRRERPASAQGGVLEWLRAVYARPVYRLLLGSSKLACSAGPALLALLVSVSWGWLGLYWRGGQAGVWLCCLLAAKGSALKYPVSSTF